MPIPLDERGNSLPPPAQQFLARMQMEARGSTSGLAESWKRPVRHNLKLERLALWHAVRLEASCENALDDECGPSVLPLSPSAAAPESRYEVEAAVRMVPQLMPFTHCDLDRLRAPIGVYFEKWGDEMADREPQLVARWHRWLWAESSSELYEPENYADAALLGCAAHRLAEGLETLLGWHRG
jgi:hypothetical protein